MGIQDRSPKGKHLSPMGGSGSRDAPWGRASLASKLDALQGAPQLHFCGAKEATRVPKRAKNVMQTRTGGRLASGPIFRGGATAISVLPLQREHRNHFPTGFPK